MQDDDDNDGARRGAEFGNDRDDDTPCKDIEAQPIGNEETQQ